MPLSREWTGYFNGVPIVKVKVIALAKIQSARAKLKFMFVGYHQVAESAPLTYNLAFTDYFYLLPWIAIHAAKLL